MLGPAPGGVEGAVHEDQRRLLAVLLAAEGLGGSGRRSASAAKEARDEGLEGVAGGRSSSSGGGGFCGGSGGGGGARGEDLHGEPRGELHGAAGDCIGWVGGWWVERWDGMAGYKSRWQSFCWNGPSGGRDGPLAAVVVAVDMERWLLFDGLDGRLRPADTYSGEEEDGGGRSCRKADAPDTSTSRSASTGGDALCVGLVGVRPV